VEFDLNVWAWEVKTDGDPEGLWSPGHSLILHRSGDAGTSVCSVTLGVNCNSTPAPSPDRRGTSWRRRAVIVRRRRSVLSRRTRPRSSSLVVWTGLASWNEGSNDWGVVRTPFPRTAARGCLCDMLGSVHCRSDETFRYYLHRFYQMQQLALHTASVNNLAIFLLGTNFHTTTVRCSTSNVHTLNCLKVGV